METIRTYLTYLKMQVKSSSEYKASFYVNLFANFYCYFITYATFWVITNRFSNIGGWDFTDLSILFGTNHITYAISGAFLFGSIYCIDREVTRGGLDRFLVRPMGVIPQMMLQLFGYSYIGQIIATTIFMSAAYIRIAPRLTLLTVVYMIFAYAGAIALQSGMMFLVGALSFWTLRSRDIGWVIYFDIRGFINYPIHIYPRYFRIILSTVFPYAFINYYPSTVILNKMESGLDLLLGLISPLIGFGILALGLLAFNKGLNRYESAGN